MITDGKNWHYLTVKGLSALLRGIASNQKEGFYCLNCFNSYNTKEKHKKNLKKYVMIMMIIVTQKYLMKTILKYNHREKSMRVPLIIYADLEYLLEKMQSCQKNLEKFYTEKKAKHMPSGQSLFTIVHQMQQKISSKVKIV